MYLKEEISPFCAFLQIAIHLLQRGVSAAALDSQGATPLHYAACNGNQELCELFLGMLDLLCSAKIQPFPIYII